MPVQYAYNEELYDPMLVNMTDQGRSLTVDERVSLWDEFNSLPEDTQTLLVSDKVARVLTQMQRDFQIDHESMLYICVFVRLYYFQKLSLGSFQQQMGNWLGQRLVRLDAIMAFIVQEVFTLKPDVKVDPVEKKNHEQLFLLDALARYPRINEQQITSERIVVKSEKEPVRATVRNWLRAYRDVLGVRRHTAIERGQFIFSSENAKKLSSIERERLAVMFKSLDEQEPLAIDPSRQEIVFSEKQIFTSSQPQMYPQTFAAPTPSSMASRETSPAVSPASSEGYQTAGEAPYSVRPAFDTQQHPLSMPASVPDPQSLRFSSGQTLSTETQAATPISRVPSAPRHTFSSQSSPRLRVEPPKASNEPVTKPKEVWQIPSGLSNVVDLRSED